MLAAAPRSLHLADERADPLHRGSVGLDARRDLACGDGGLAVFQTFTQAPVVKGTAISAVEGTPFSGTVATFTDATPGANVEDFSATINWGDGTPTVTVTSTAGANGQIVPDPVDGLDLQPGEHVARAGVQATSCRLRQVCRPSGPAVLTPARSLPSG